MFHLKIVRQLKTRQVFEKFTIFFGKIVFLKPTLTTLGFLAYAVETLRFGEMTERFIAKNMK